MPTRRGEHFEGHHATASPQAMQHCCQTWTDEVEAHLKRGGQLLVPRLCWYGARACSDQGSAHQRMTIPTEASSTSD